MQVLAPMHFAHRGQVDMQSIQVACHWGIDWQACLPKIMHSCTAAWGQYRV